MAEIIAKLSSEYKNVLSKDSTIVKDLDKKSIESIEFDSNYKLDADEWFIIKNFSETEYFIGECKEDFSTASLNQINNDDYGNICAVAIFQNNKKYFLRITPSFFINKKTILDYSGEPKIIEHRKQIELKEESDAVYDVEEDILYFRDIGKIKAIFPSIEKLYREATQQEVDEFMQNDFIQHPDMPSDEIGSLNRKRIANLTEKYSHLNDDKKQKLIDYAKQYSGLTIENNQFVINTETELKNLLYAMDQRYYYADIYEESRVANSVRVIK